MAAAGSQAITIIEGAPGSGKTTTLAPVVSAYQEAGYRVLGAAAAKSPANITRILDRLERKGRVVRRPNPEDRRSSLVFLTTEGARLCDEVISLFQGLRHHLMHGIGETERDTAVMVLERITNNIGRMSAQGGPQSQPSQFDPQKEYTR